MRKNKLMLIDQLIHKGLLLVDNRSTQEVNNLLQITKKGFLYKGRKFELRMLDVLMNGSSKRETNTKPIAATPASLFGILRKIA